MKKYEVVVKDDNIEVSWYQDSEITSVHDIVEAHNGSSSLIVIEAATGAVGIAEILIKHDTILIKSMPLYLYKKLDQAFEYKIKLDTSITYEYWLQKDRMRHKFDCLIT